MESTVSFSIIDSSLIEESSTANRALDNTLKLAALTDELGFSRIWIPEHHNSIASASTSPSVLSAFVLERTVRLGVVVTALLRNHSPLVIAEQIGTLKSFHPGRVSVSLGRAAGADEFTALALRATSFEGEPDPFRAGVGELIRYFEGSSFHDIRAMTCDGSPPEIFVNGIDEKNAVLAGQLGLPFLFLYHLGSGDLASVCDAYRNAFRISRAAPKPRIMLSVNVICATTTEEAAWMAESGRLDMLLLRTGKQGKFPSPERSLMYRYDSRERSLVHHLSKRDIVGDSGLVQEGLLRLVQKVRPDEIVVHSPIFGVDSRRQSLELLALTLGLAKRNNP
jgi:luciferase family oxidoreductase group 1